MELDGVEAEQCVGALVEQVAHPPRRLHVFDYGTDIDDGLGGQPRHGRAPDVFDADHLLADHLPHASRSRSNRSGHSGSHSTISILGVTAERTPPDGK